MLQEVLISVGGIALTVVLAWWLGKARAGAAFDARQAMTIAEEALVGFDADTAYVDPAARGALVVGRGGGAALLKAHGDHWSVRALPPGTRATLDGADLIVALPEAMFGAVRLSVGESAARSLAARIGN